MMKFQEPRRRSTVTTAIAGFAATLLCAATPPAAAADDWYVALRASAASSMIDETSHGGTIGTGATIGGEIDGNIRDPDSDDVTAGVGFAFGRRFGAWAVEADYHWRYRTDWDVSIATPAIQTITNVQSNVESSTLMLNAIRSGALGGTWSWELGAGVGFVYNRLESDYIEREVPGVSPQQTFSDDDNSTEFAWGVLAGVARPLGDVWRMSLRYRYSDFGELEAGPFPSRAGELTADYTAHELYLSFERDL